MVLGIEHSPRLEVKEGLETYFYTWTRMEAGRSFMIGAPLTIGRLATCLRVVPKVGVLSLDAYFPIDASDGLTFATISQFRVSRQLEIGGEVSWDLEALSYRMKAWATTHLSRPVLAEKNSTKILNQRGGVDLSYDLLRTGDGFRVGFLGFGYIDWVTLQKENAQASSLTQASRDASYNVTYFGAGFSMTW
ncbi:MAG: hypothetical protein H7318_17550 [Oligoflexus sp.]|nr:hypothetical protein [Oligoflexus sp.]